MADTHVAIDRHTTVSFPRPHVVYLVDVTPHGSAKYALQKRYSDFVELQKRIGDKLALPPKRILTTTFIPSAWVDDKLIAERKAGLTAYLSALLSSPEYASSPALARFLAPASAAAPVAALHPEDALPSTLSRNAVLNAQAGLSAQAATPIAAAYYPWWSAWTRTPESLDFSKFDILFYAFVIPSANLGITFDEGSPDILRRLVAAKNASGKGTKIVLSVGGWGGCQYFSQTMSSSPNRGTFIANLASTVSTYGLDGIDIDWEYPNSPGAGQPFSSADAANLLTFFTYLRISLGTSKIISAAVAHLPWLGSNGQPLGNVAAYAAQVDYVNIMNYDVYSASATPGPNAPLGNLCGTAAQPQASAQAAVAQWTAAGFPKSKLLLGLPLYGYVSQSSRTVLAGAFAPAGMKPNENAQRLLAVQEEGAPEGEPVGDEETHSFGEAHDRTFAKKKALAARDGAPGEDAPPQDGAEPAPEQKAVAGDLSGYWGQQIAFNQIIGLGAIQKSGSVYVQANGYTQGWDNCSDTPFVYNTSRTTVVTYDDTYSLGDKAAYAKSAGLAGCFTWSLDQDDGYTLQNVIRSKLGK